jgi:formylmethanofuran dehydrogenase subunit A
MSEPAAGGTIRIKGGAIWDPAHGRRGEPGDLCIRDGRVVDSLPPGAPVFDARGLLVLPGGVDLHSHVAGPALRVARLLCPEAAGGPCLPATDDTGRRYAAMGYTTVFEAAVAPIGARAAHHELDALPIVDKGLYVLAGNNAIALDLARRGREEELRACLAWLVESARAYAVKLVNPGGVEAWKEGRAPGEAAPLLAALVRAVDSLGLPHPAHVHLPGLGSPGNAALTLSLLDAIGAARVHLTHLQFHAYGGRTPAGLSSRAPEIAAWLNTHPRATADVGQVVFGPAVTLSADAPAQDRLHRLTGRKWANLDIEGETACGVVPHEYRSDRLVSAVQWAAGLELLLLADDPWRIALTTDHPNGGPFTAYPTIVRLLMDRAFRDAVLRRAPERLARRTVLAGLAREYTFEEIVIVTRAGPARTLGLTRKGHLGAGADGDVALLRDAGDPETTFATPVAVFKDGILVAREGEIVATPAGRTFHAAPRPGDARGARRFAALLPEAFAATHASPLEDFALPREALARPEAIVAGAA